MASNIGAGSGTSGSDAMSCGDTMASTSRSMPRAWLATVDLMVMEMEPSPGFSNAVTGWFCSALVRTQRRHTCDHRGTTAPART
jgi:hypothetical protein